VDAGLSKAGGAVTAMVGGRLIDGTGKPPIENSVVILREGKIAAAGPADGTPVPEGAQVIDAHGKSVLPGLWEMHAHFEQVEWGLIYLAAGVTTARDVGNEREFIMALRDALACGPGIRARRGRGREGCLWASSRRIRRRRRGSVCRNTRSPASSRLRFIAR